MKLVNLSTLLVLLPALSGISQENKLGEEWTKKISIDPAEASGGLAAKGLEAKAPVNWFTGRWPYISFLGGMAMGNRSEDLEFFYTEPFNWHTTVLDYQLESASKVFGMRAKIQRYKERPPIGKVLSTMQSFLLNIRTDVYLKEYHPSFIYVNGRKVWDYKKNALSAGGINVPFSVEDAVDLLIDVVVDKGYTPETKGLAFRMFTVYYIYEAGTKSGKGCKVDFANAEEKATGSPADAPGMKHFVFGLFPSGYDFWTTNGPTFAQIKSDWKWKPNFRPDYPIDDYFTCPYIMDSAGKGKYYQFMSTYGGCNVASVGTTADMFKANPFLRGALTDTRNAAADAKRVVDIDPKLRAFWFRGEEGSGANDKAKIEAWKQATGHPERVTSMYEPFPPALIHHREYERGTDLVIFKNEEDPQWNIVTSMARGAGRTFGKPFGFYWEQTHYPFPSVDEKLHVCLMHYFSGGSWSSAELDDAPAFEREVVADWVLPLVQSYRFSMLHPARGQSIVPVGIIYNSSDVWWVPFNPFGQMDTFQRYVEYDSGRNQLVCEPSFTKLFPWMQNESKSWRYTGHTSMFLDKLDELQGYNLLDVFLPQYGDAYTAHITRLLTGTPYGPVDFVPLEKASVDHLKSYRLLACLGKGLIRKDPREDTEALVLATAQNGSQVVIAAQDFPQFSGSISSKPFGLTFSKASEKAAGAITGLAEIYKGHTGRYSGNIFSANGDGWETAALVSGKPLIVRKQLAHGMIYVYLGQWVHQGGDALRPLLAYCGDQTAPLKFNKPDDQLEYVAYKKNAGAWVALFNHGNIVMGCDRLQPTNWRVQPPEPLFTHPKGPYKGTLEFRLEKFGLQPSGDFALYQVEGLDGKAFDDLISGNRTFELHEVKTTAKDGVISAEVIIDKRAEFVIAPRGKANDVFFGKP